MFIGFGKYLRQTWGVILDYDENDNVIGIEILGICKRVPEQTLKSLQFETV